MIWEDGEWKLSNIDNISMIHPKSGKFAPQFIAIKQYFWNKNIVFCVIEQC